jgi:transcriptional regulator with XRE-family HTH domain
MHAYSDSKDIHPKQGEAPDTPSAGPVTIAFVGQKRPERVIPESWRNRLAEHVEEWIATQPKGRSERALASVLGISQFTLNKIRNREGPLGLHVLVALRGVLRVPVDSLLGLEPLEPRAPSTPPLVKFTPEQMAQIKELLLSQKGEPKSPAKRAHEGAVVRPIRRRV